MSRKTLDQIRAKIALDAKNNIVGGADGGDKIKNFPTMIQNNGLLGALAYACELKKDGLPKNNAEYQMSEHICKYINELTNENYSVTQEKFIGEPNDLIKHLSECSPEEFRRINAEVMSFMNYFRRFAS